MNKRKIKNLYPYLSKSFPDRKIYVISDQHFYHENIINLVRTEFNNIEDMHNQIISSHNSIITKEDIVIFLGDYSFSKRKIKDITQKLNGIKFILLGNHDSVKIINNFKDLGFENVYQYPLKLKEDYLSHQPLTLEEANNFDFKYKSNAFIKNKTSKNYHGHIHDIEKYPNEKGHINATVEALNYKPLLIGKTEKQTKEKETFQIINSSIFNDVVNDVSKSTSCSTEHVIKDYIYSSGLSEINKYKDYFYTFGSYAFYKKYNYVTHISDLDIGILFNEEISIKQNYKYLKLISNEITILLNSFDMNEVEYYKRIDGLHILISHYHSGYSPKIVAPFDINCTKLSFAKPGDLIKSRDISLIETAFPELGDEYNLPSYQTQYYSDNVELVNMLIQLFFQKGYNDKKILLTKKINFLSRKKDVIDYSIIEDQFIRYFIKNVYLLCSRKRYNEIRYILEIKHDLEKYINKLNPEIRDLARYIFIDDNSLFNQTFKEMFDITEKVQLPGNCKKLIKKI